MIWLAGLPVIWWAAILIADAIQPGRNLFELMEVLTEKLNHPFQLHYTEYTIKSVLVCTLLYAAGIGIFYSSQKNYRRGEEHGSARWGDARQICKKYSQKPYSQNILLTQNFRISLDTHKHRRCLNILVVGGSGAGKSRGFALPNIMQCCCSMVITDPKAELLRKTGGLLEKKGYEVRVFDLINPDTSFCYNPFEYVHDDKDVLRLISNLIQNTTPKGSQSSDPFWEKSETALLQALMLYLLHEAPPEEQNFAMIMEMLGSAQVKEEDEDYESPLDILFDRLEMRDPDSIAVKQYHIYKQAAGKTAKSILISVGVRLAAFNLPQIAKLTNTDELDLSSMGERKVALFCCIPDADTSLNYLVGMIYSQLFQTLYYMADRVHGGALPVPVNCIMDEFPNVSLPNEFEKILATCRSRSIYCSIIIQNMSQLKALFKDSWESLVGNCDEFLYLGGNEKETHKYVSELLGKETIDTNTYGQTKGNYRYVTVGTFDSYMFQTVERKAGFISQIMNSDSPAREASDVGDTVLNLAQMKALATGDPKIAERMEAENRLTQLTLLKRAHAAQQKSIRFKIDMQLQPTVDSLEVQHAEAVDDEPAFRKAAALREEYRERGVCGLDLGNGPITDRKQAIHDLTGIARRLGHGQTVEAGEYCGMTVVIENRDMRVKGLNAFHPVVGLKDRHVHWSGNGMPDINNSADNVINQLGRIISGNTDTAQSLGVRLEKRQGGSGQRVDRVVQAVERTEGIRRAHRQDRQNGHGDQGAARPTAGRHGRRHAGGPSRGHVPLQRPGRRSNRGRPVIPVRFSRHGHGRTGNSGPGPLRRPRQRHAGRAGPQHVTSSMRPKA